VRTYVHAFGGFEEVRDEDEEVDEDLVAGTLDLVVLEEDVHPEEPEGLVDDVLAVDWLETLAARTVEFALEGDQRQSAGHSALEDGVEGRMLRLSHRTITMLCD
jgi:hypothetical protein